MDTIHQNASDVADPNWAEYQQFEDLGEVGRDAFEDSAVFPDNSKDGQGIDLDQMYRCILPLYDWIQARIDDDFVLASYYYLRRLLLHPRRIRIEHEQSVQLKMFEVHVIVHCRNLNNLSPITI